MSERRGNWWFGGALAAAWSVALFLIAPMIIVAPVSLTDRRYLSLPQDALSLRHYEALISNPIWLASFWQSLLVAAVATLLAVAVGTAAAVGAWRIASRTSEWVRGLLLLPLIVPSIIHALGFYRAWIDLDLLDSFVGVVLANGIVSMPYVVITVSASLANFDPRLEQAARNLGASVLQSVRRVILPNILPGILSGAIFAFIHAWDEIVVLLFITSRRFYLLPRAIWDGIQEAVDPAIAALATILIALTAALMIAERWLRYRHQDMKGAPTA